MVVSRANDAGAVHAGAYGGLMSWSPSIVTRELWPPDYVRTFAWRQKQLMLMRKESFMLLGAKAHYKNNPIDFINHWCDTYDPRNVGSPLLLPKPPFVLFERQAEFIRFLHMLLVAQQSGLVEKARDMGATWLCCAFSIWLWLFWPGAAVGWGSRKENLVDRLGDADSIFEKMRMLVRRLPACFLPKGFSEKDHMTYMRFVNPETDSSITGESGDNIGRGGRKLIYFKDESAHYERPEKIEAALSENTRVQIDISSVNGLGNIFHRKREAGVDWAPGNPIVPGRTNVFVMDWRDHPDKTESWYEGKRRKAEEEGLLHVFRQEVDRDYAGALQGVIIPPEWVRAAIDAHVHLGFSDIGGWIGGLDVADTGGDTNALALRRGSVLWQVEEWGERDTGETTRRAVAACDALKAPVELQYDAVGVGAGVKAEANRLAADGWLPRKVQLLPWNAGAAVLEPDERVIPGDLNTPLNKDFYMNLKAQAWWQLRRRFENTWRARNEKGFTFKPEDLISLPRTLPLLRKIEKELSQPTMGRSSNMRLLIDKQPEGTRSPNLADAIVMAYWPASLPRMTISAEALKRAGVV